MTNVTQIHRGKQPNRPHYIPAWAEKRQLHTQAEFAAALDADKSVVSRWYSGSTPSLEWQEKLALFFEIDREALFRHPDDDWIAKFFRGRSEEERERMKKMLEAAFPLKTGTGG
jgi:transcriptional regulator with XRE-family HTH domain